MSKTFLPEKSVQIKSITFSKTKRFDWKNPRTSNFKILSFIFTEAVFSSDKIVPEK